MHLAAGTVFVGEGPGRYLGIGPVMARGDIAMGRENGMMQHSVSRRNFLRRAALAGAALPALSILAACGGSTPATTAPAPTAPATTTQPTGAAGAAPAAPAAATPAGMATAAMPAKKLSGAVEFWSRETQNNGARQPLINDRLAAFDKANGTMSKAQFMIFAESVQKTQAALAANTLPDLGQQGPDVTLQFAAADNLLPIDDLYSSIKDTFLPLQKEAFVNYENKAYSVPWYTETRVLFYHKDLLDKAGVKPPTTWQEWADAAKALTKGDEQYGFVFSPEGPAAGQLFIPLATSAGAPILDKDGKVNANTEGHRAALTFLSDMYKAKSIPPATPTYKSTDVTQLFVLKKAAMIWSNGEVLLSLKDMNPDALKTLGAVLTPVRKMGDTSRSFLGGFQLFVFKGGKNPDAGKELLRSLLDPAWYADYIAKTGGAALPVTKAVASSDTYQKDPILKVLVEQQQTAVRYGGPIYGNTPYMGDAEAKLLFSQPVVDVFTGKRSVDEGVMYLDTELKKLAKQA